MEDQINSFCKHYQCMLDRLHHTYSHNFDHRLIRGPEWLSGKVYHLLPGGPFTRFTGFFYGIVPWQDTSQPWLSFAETQKRYKKKKKNELWLKAE